MERREFVRKTVGVAAVGGLLAGCTKTAEGPAVHTNPRVRWRLASSFPKTLDTIFGAADQLSSRVSALTGGRFDIRVYQAGEVVPAMQVLDSARQGAVDIAHTASYYFQGKEKALVFDTAVPFGLTARQQTAWLCQGGGLELMRELFAGFGLINFPGGNTGVQMGGWFRNPVRSLADLKGLTMRIPGMGGDVMDQLGVTVQVLPAQEIYSALERGAIDATEWVGPYDDQKLGFQQITKNYHYPGWWEPGPGLSFYINRAAWDALPTTYQAAVETAAAESTLTMMNEYDAKNPVAARELGDQGVKFIPFPDDVMRAAHTATQETLSDLAASDPKFRKVYEHWSRFRDMSSDWFATAEQSYADFVYRR